MINPLECLLSILVVFFIHLSSDGAIYILVLCAFFLNMHVGMFSEWSYRKCMHLLLIGSTKRKLEDEMCQQRCCPFLIIFPENHWSNWNSASQEYSWDDCLRNSCSCKVNILFLTLEKLCSIELQPSVKQPPQG